MQETKQYLQFTLGQEHYAVQMSYVREITKPLEVTKLIGCPTFVLGVCKIRDEIITIIDLHKKFCISIDDQSKGEPRIIILEFGTESVGLYVDDVVEIIETMSIEDVPNLIPYGTIRKIIKMENQLIPVLDIEQLFSNNVQNDENDVLIS